MASMTSLSIFLFWVVGLLLVFISYTITLENTIYAPFSLLSRRDDSFSNIENSTLGFQKIFTLNLPSRSDRRDTMTLMASVTGIDLEFMPGVGRHGVVERAIPDDVGYSLEVSSMELISLLPIDERPVNLSKAELGAWRGHMNVIRQLVSPHL